MARPILSTVCGLPLVESINVSVSGVSVFILSVNAVSSCSCDEMGRLDAVADVGIEVELFVLDLAVKYCLLIGDEFLLSSMLVMDVSMPSSVDTPSDDDLDTVTIDF